MSKPNPTDRKYSQEHEWALPHGDGTATMGITDHAQELLTDIVFVELPALGRQVRQGEAVAVVESVKSVSDVFAPLSGEVIAVNRALEDRPELINEDACGEGWIAKLKLADPQEYDGLMDAAAYDAFIRDDAH